MAEGAGEEEEEAEQQEQNKNLSNRDGKVCSREKSKISFMTALNYTCPCQWLIEHFVSVTRGIATCPGKIYRSRETNAELWTVVLWTHAKKSASGSWDFLSCWQSSIVCQALCFTGSSALTEAVGWNRRRTAALCVTNPPSGILPFSNTETLNININPPTRSSLGEQLEYSQPVESVASCLIWLSWIPLNNETRVWMQGTFVGTDMNTAEVFDFKRISAEYWI